MFFGHIYVYVFRHIVCGFVDDREVYAFEIYCPLFRSIWSKETALDFLWDSFKSLVAYRHDQYAEMIRCDRVLLWRKYNKDSGEDSMI